MNYSTVQYIYSTVIVAVQYSKVGYIDSEYVWQTNLNSKFNSILEEVKRDKLQYSTINYNTVQYSTIFTVQYN